MVAEVVKKKKANSSTSKQNRKLKFGQSTSNHQKLIKRKPVKNVCNEDEERDISQFPNNILKLPPMQTIGIPQSIPEKKKKDSIAHYSFSSTTSTSMLALPVVSSSSADNSIKMRRCSLTTNVLKNVYK